MFAASNKVMREPGSDILKLISFGGFYMAQLVFYVEFPNQLKLRFVTHVCDIVCIDNMEGGNLIVGKMYDKAFKNG